MKILVLCGRDEQIAFLTTILICNKMYLCNSFCFLAKYAAKVPLEMPMIKIRVFLSGNLQHIQVSKAIGNLKFQNLVEWKNSSHCMYALCYLGFCQNFIQPFLVFMHIPFIFYKSYLKNSKRIIKLTLAYLKLSTLRNTRND